MGMGMKSLKWEAFVTKNLFPHISTSQFGSGGAPAANEFGALQSCQKATGGNHFEYSEVHVLQQVDQNLAQK